MRSGGTPATAHGEGARVSAYRQAIQQARNKCSYSRLGGSTLLPESRVTSCCTVHEMPTEETEGIYQLVIRLTLAESKWNVLRDEVTHYKGIMVAGKSSAI